jgi:hypothetical protein
MAMYKLSVAFLAAATTTRARARKRAPFRNGPSVVMSRPGKFVIWRNLTRLFHFLALFAKDFHK